METEKILEIPSVHLADGYDCLLCTSLSAGCMMALRTRTISSRLLQSLGSNQQMIEMMCAMC